jgi:hypothetical protein
MTTRTLKLIAFIVLLVHGIGHFQGVAAGFGLPISKAKPGQSWLFRGAPEQTSRIMSLILFLATGVTGILTALSFKGILLPQSIWGVLAIVTAVLSTLCLIIFPGGFAMFFNKVGAVAVNLIIYYSIVFQQQWPSTLFED